ncbi:MAG: hypothetical protein DLM55_06805 [Acidimicrobiales bacterium]|nr:MAG: hypothetical protein DLM55_06805 [Acidimicrobiales bacterium]
MEKRRHVLAKCLEGYIDYGLLSDFRQEISYSEYGLGLENLCERLLESDCRLPKAILDDIAEAARLMQLPAERWDFVLTLEE